MKKKTLNILAWAAIAVIIIGALVIYYWPSSPSLNEETMRCIAQNSKPYVSKTCPHCAEQKRILGDHLNLFNMTDCLVDRQACIDAQIEYVPTWDINGNKTTGVFEIEQLKQMTGCN